MKVFFLALAIVAICVFGMCFNIIFRKDGKFPEYEVGSNSRMRKMGIRCMKEEEMHRKCADRKDIKLECNESCSNCRETECR